jgi:DhnA family fructose-bisphosphate aldolase class Ia
MTTSTMQNTSENKRGKLSKGPIKRKVQARASVKKVKKNADGLAAKLFHQGRDAVSSAYDSAAKAGAKASRSLPHLPNDLHLRSRGQSIYTMMEEHPIVMGAVGLGVGMVLAALLPSFSSDRQKH